MKLVVDTGVFSAALSRRPPSDLEPAVARLAGNQLFIAVQTVAEQSCDDVCSLLVRAARHVVVELTGPASRRRRSVLTHSMTTTSAVVS